MKPSTSDHTTEANPVTYVGYVPRTAPPDPIDNDFGLTPMGCFWIILAFGASIVFSWFFGAVPH